MRAAMCLSYFQLPRCQIHAFSGFWWKNIHSLSSQVENTSKLHLVSPNINGLQGGQNKRPWSRKSVSTNTEGKNIRGRKTNNISQQITDVTSLTHGSLNTSRLEFSESKSVHIEQEILENKEISKHVTIIVFDIETTGFSRDNDRIIEIAAQDLSGGENSTFQTLVNPEKYVGNSHIHGISTYKVNKPGIPRMKELIPILVQYVQSRQKPGGQIILIAHNGKSFDVPFLKSEFSRCNYVMPSNWRFSDTMSLAREFKNLDGVTLEKLSLEALREYYKIPLIGQAHRAMADVNVLALVLQRLTCDLKLTVPMLLENYTFTAAELINNSKKKKNN